MRRAAAVGLLLAACAALVWYALTGSPGNAGGVATDASARAGDAAPTTTTGGTSEPASSSNATPQHRARAARSRSPDDDPHGDVPAPRAFVVLHADGTPAAGAVATTVTTWMEPTTHTADDAGRVAFDELETARVAAFQFTTSAGEAALVPRSAAPPIVETVVRLRPGVRVAGRVEDEGGAAVGGALCQLTWPAGRTPEDGSVEWAGTADDAGRFDFGLLPRPEGGQRARIAAGADGFLDVSVEVDVGGLGAPIVVCLDRGVTVRGRCVDEAGAPLAFIVVRSGAAGAMASAVGVFELGAVRRGALVTIDDSSRAPVAVAAVGVGPVIDLHDVLVPAGRTIRGTVVFEDGSPATTGSVSIEGRGSHGWTRSAGLGDDGGFVLAGLPDGVLTVQAYAVDDLGPTERSGVATGVPAGATGVRIVVDARPRVLLRLVRASDRAAVPAAHVSVEGTPSADPADAAGGAGTAASPPSVWTAAGPDAVLDVPAGTWDLVVRVPGFRPATLAEVTSSPGLVTVSDVELEPVPR